ncbi:hypothetical protein BJ878DRAFT_590 [Calycina marina]|uniref:Uncharacterized protein n=1 Tax=Calycina marina TaxID=1763456 RepID=A0A9P7ZBX8_9HELO|nr:hypothetical protein BJ878DRAFT_590 [Calycina marina]
MFKIHITRRWKVPKVLYSLFVIELAGSVATLALFGIADPDLYRTKLWQIGSDNGFNSSPLQILYAYANYQPIPKTPLVWSQTLTHFNLVISVLSVFMLLVKAVMFIMHVWYPLLGVVTNAALTALWIVSAYGQAGPDHSDPEHTSNVAWYIAKSCSYADPTNNKGYCLQAKGAFAATVVMCVVFFVNMALGIWSMIPTASERTAKKVEIDDMQVAGGKDGSPVSNYGPDKEWEMKNVSSRVETVPYTPRTLAFNTLDRQLPLRAEPSGAPRFG